MKLMKKLGYFALGAIASLMVTTHTAEIKDALPSSLKSMMTTEHVVLKDLGGEIYSKMDFYHNLRRSGDSLRIEGLCASACTFFLGLMPSEKVCATPSALFGFHGVYKTNGIITIFDPAMTRWTYEYVYPLETRMLLEDKGWSMDTDVDKTLNPTGLIWLRGSELGVKPCGQ